VFNRPTPSEWAAAGSEDTDLSVKMEAKVEPRGQLANSAHDHSVKGNFTWRL
jgi:hypothetical protein